MAGGWITGEKIVNLHGVAAFEIGQACFDGQLSAHFQAAWGAIYDISQLERVPKYPPRGVDRLLHRQKGEKVEWQWDEILGINELQKKLREKEAALRAAIAVWKAKDRRTLLARAAQKQKQRWELFCPVDIDSILPYELNPPKKQPNHSGICFTCAVPDNPCKAYSFDELSNIIGVLTKQHELISEEVRQKIQTIIDAKISLNDYNNKWTNIEKLVYGYDIPYEYYYLIDGNLIEEKDMESRLFFFNFDMFMRRMKEQYQCSTQQAMESYCRQIGSMWFRSTEVEAWLNPPSAGQEKKSEETAIAPTDMVRIPLNVPASLWAGNMPQHAYDALKESYAPEVIAVILAKLSDNKTECGRLLSQDEIDKGIERDPVTYQRKFDKFISKANTKYLLTFDG